MSFLFRSHRHSPSPETSPSPQVGGSGGKLVRARRRVTPASPYARPVPLLSAPPGSAESGSPGGFFGLLFGAGKAISSVFWSGSSSAESETDSDDESFSGDDEDSHPPKALPRLTQRRESSELVNVLEEARAIVPISKTKLSIQNLLMQETFSRDECDRLKKLIETRVVDSSSTEFMYKGRDNSEMNAGKAVGSLGVQQSLNQNIELPKSASYSPTNMGAFSSKSPQFSSPDIRNTAVIEAKKWLEEKNKTLPSKSDLVYGPCVLSTDMLHYDIEDEINSPADLAKSYMRSIPPWQSPSLSDLMSPPSRLKSLLKDKNPDESASSLPSFKVFKRKYLSNRLSDSTKDARLLCMRSTDVALDPKLEKFDLSETFFQSNTRNISSAADKNKSKLSAMNLGSTSLPAANTPNVSVKLSEELHSEIHDIEAFRLHGGTSVKLTDSTIVNKTIPVSTTSGPEQTFKSNSLPELKTAISEGIVPKKQNNGNGSSSPANDRTNYVQRSVPDDTLMLNNSGGQKLDSETKSHNAHSPTKNEANGCLIESSANDSAAKSNVDSDDGMGHSGRTGSKNRSVSGRSFELPAENKVETTVDFDTEGMSSKKGKRKRSAGWGMAEPSPRANTRTKRAVAKVKRGRDKPKGSATS